MASLLGKHPISKSTLRKERIYGDEIIELKKYVDAKLAVIERASLNLMKTEELNLKFEKMEEKITDLTQLIKLMKAYTESQEQENVKLRQQLQNDLVHPSPKEIELEKRIEFLEKEVVEAKSNFEETTQNIQGNITKQGTEIAKELQRIEQKINFEPSGPSEKEIVSQQIINKVTSIENTFNTWKEQLESELAGWRRQFNSIEAQNIKVEETHEIASKAIESCTVMGEKLLQRIKVLETEQQNYCDIHQSKKLLKKQSNENLNHSNHPKKRQKLTGKSLKIRKSLPSRNLSAHFNINLTQKVKKKKRIEDPPNKQLYKATDMSPFSKERLALMKAATMNLTKRFQNQF